MTSDSQMTMSHPPPPPQPADVDEFWWEILESKNTGTDESNTVTYLPTKCIFKAIDCRCKMN